MKKVVAILFLILLIDFSAQAWGFWAHSRINRIAVFTLPPEMIGFYKKNIEYLTEHAVDPDKRRYATKDEAPRHYIDIDHYEHYPFDTMPQRWNDAVEKFSEDTLQTYGIVPWHVYRMTFWLTDAFKQKDLKKILRLSAEIGHYIGDAHVPLHTTENYNGQMTGQKGIHGFWESRLPELYGEDYDYFIGKAEYIEDFNEQIWEVVATSHLALDSVLEFERELTNEFPSDKKYGYQQKATTTISTYSEVFSKAYHDKLDGMVERRMRKAILSVGSFWFTCWVNAGQPELEEFGEYEKDEEELKEDKELDKEYQAGKIKGREHND